MTGQVSIKANELVSAVENYTKTRGKCENAYKHMAVCFDDNCIYCNMVRAYLKLTNLNNKDDTKEGHGL